MISEEEYERKFSGESHFTVSLGMHLFCFGSVTSKLPVQVKSVRKVTLQHLPWLQRRTLGLFPPLGASEIRKEQLMASSSQHCWWSDAREPRVGESWWPCVAHTSSARPGAGISATRCAGWWPRDGLALGGVLVLSTGFMALLFSKGIFLTRVFSCCSAWWDKETSSIFCLCLMFFTGVKLHAVFFMKRAKTPLDNWSYKLTDPTSRCLYKVFWWIFCKRWKINNWAWYN